MQSKEEVLKSRAALFVDIEVPRATKNEPWTSLVEKVKEAKENAVLIVDEAHKLIGIITDQDILKALSNPDLAEKIKSNEVTAGDIMTPLAPHEDTVARSSDSLEDVIAKLQGNTSLKQQLKVIPIVDASGIAIGQVTRSSIRKNLDELL